MAYHRQVDTLTRQKFLEVAPPFFLGVVLAVAFWQLEVIWIGWATEWGYDFGGFGDFGWKPYQWRDFWYTVIFLVFIGLLVLTWRSK